MSWTENKWLKPAWMGGNNDFVTKYQDKFSQIGEKFAPKVKHNNIPKKASSDEFVLLDGSFIKFKGISMEAEFKIKGMKKATDLQIIQVAQVSIQDFEDSLEDKSGYLNDSDPRFDNPQILMKAIGNENYWCFVDGGILSPYTYNPSTGKLDGLAAYEGKPYYIPQEYHDIFMTWGDGNELYEEDEKINFDVATLRTEDKPDAVGGSKFVKFETILVAVGYNKQKNVDKVIGAFKWAFEDGKLVSPELENGELVIKFPKIEKKLYDISDLAVETIRHYYPKYKLLT